MVDKLQNLNGWFLMQKTKDEETDKSARKKYYCRRCGEEISEEEYNEYDGFCESCYWLEEDELDEDLFF
jgi:ribosomal protein L37E